MKKQPILLIAFFMLIIGGYTQETGIPATPELRFDKSGHVKYIKFDGKNKTGKWNSPASAEGFFKNILNANKQDEFVLKNKREKKGGLFTGHYRQFYRGVEVEGGIFILHFKNRKLTKANGHYINTTGIDPLPKLTPSEAAQSYATYLQIPNASSLKFIHGMVVAEIETISGIDTTFNARLCYKIDLLGSFDNKGETGYIDAHTGKVLKTQKNWYNSSATGTFSTLYSGTRSAGTQYYNNVFNLIDSSRNAIINTWDINNSDWDTYAANAVEFTDNNNTWTVQEHSTNDDQMALDIHWALQEIYDYFEEEYELQSFDNNDHPIDAFVHCELPDGFGGTTRDNAMFNVFPNGDQVFFFGDGELTFKPLGALDVVAHEFSHAITHNHTGWATLTTVRRAMHEGFSDIWGVVIENEVASEKDHWKIGEEVIDVAGDDCLRNIQNPESSTSYTQIADCFGDDRYNDGGNDEVYEKSGILSHWFYLLSEGGDGQNDNNDDYLVYGLGIDMAAKIVFEGQTGHFADVDNYTEARTAMVDATDDLFGENSFQSLQVENAWYAVGVGNQPNQVTISGSDLVCYSGSTFTANNTPAGSTISWTTSSNLTVQSGGNTTTPTIHAATSSASGTGWVQINFTSNGYTTSGPRKNVWAGKPAVRIMGLTEVAPYSSSTYTALPYYTCQLSSYLWTISSSDYAFSYHSNTNQSYPIETKGELGTFYLYLTTTNACGSQNLSKPIVVTSGGGGGVPEVAEMPSIIIYPNPATDYINVKVSDGIIAEIQENKDLKYDIILYNNNQQIVYRKKSDDNQITINTKHLEKGFYYLHFIYKKEIIKEQVIISK